MTYGVPQRSMLEPILWSLFYDDLFRLNLPLEVCIVGYADDVSVMAMAQNASLVEDVLNPALELAWDGSPIMGSGGQPKGLRR